MKSLLALCVCLLAWPSAAAAGTIIGVNEDAPKWSTDRGAAFFAQLQKMGMTEVVVSVRWDPAAPAAIEGQARLAPVVANAEAQGLKVVLAVYPARARAIADGGTAAWLAWLRSVTQAFPTVRTWIVGNEPNQPRFWQPQFDEKGRGAAPAAFGAFLAASYDALKLANKSNNVIGVGLSPRGNDNPRARSNVSTSPARFLLALGAWYRASGRKAPLMDGFSFHPYPPRNTDGPDRGYAWPNIGLPNLAVLKQVFEDAFGGTAQPTVSQGLRIHLDEIGWQADTTGRPGYTGTENVPPVDEETQAAYDARTIEAVVCDPQVASLHFFHFVDEGDRDRFQTGAIRADGSLRPAFDAIAQTIAATGSGSRCTGKPVNWLPTPLVLGGGIAFTTGRFGFVANAAEDATVRGGVFPVASGQPLPSDVQGAIVTALTGRRATNVRPAVASVSGRVRAFYRRSFPFRLRGMRPGFYVVAITLSAATTSTRQSAFVSAPFEVRK